MESRWDSRQRRGAALGPTKGNALKGLDAEKELIRATGVQTPVLLVTNFESLGRSEV